MAYSAPLQPCDVEAISRAAAMSAIEFRLSGPVFSAHETFQKKIEAAISYISRYYPAGATIVVPNGNNMLTAPLVIEHGGITIRGEDHSSCRLVRCHDDGPLITWRGGTAPGQQYYNGGIRDIFIYHQIPATHSRSPHDLVFDHVNSPHVGNLTCASSSGCLAFYGVVGLRGINWDLWVVGGADGPKNKSAVLFEESTRCQSFYAGDNRITQCNIQCGNGIAASSNADFGILIKYCDGLDIDNIHIVNTNSANVYIEPDVGVSIYNIRFSNALLDHAMNFGLLVGGGGLVDDLQFCGTVSGLGKGGVSANGIYIGAACSRVMIDANVYGYPASGIGINHPLAEVLIRPRVIEWADSDQSGPQGYGIWAIAARSISVLGGRIGGMTGTIDAPIRIGEGCAAALISGVDCRGTQGSIVIDPHSGYDDRKILINGCIVEGDIFDMSATPHKLISGNLII